MKRHPAILSFLTSIYFESDEGVKGDIKTILSQGDTLKNKVAFDGVATSRFKDNIDIELVKKMIFWIGEGYAAQTIHQQEIDYDVLAQEMNDCFDLLKNSLYKEEFI
jgi:hypothetical protein